MATTLLSGMPPIDHTKNPNAMVFQIIRTGFNYFFDGDTVVFIGRTEPPSLMEMGSSPEAGQILQIFKEQDELRQVLATTDHDSFIINPSETVHVIARFRI